MLSATLWVSFFICEMELLMIVRPGCCVRGEMSHYPRASAYKRASKAGWGDGVSIFGYLLWVPRDHEARAFTSPAEPLSDSLVRHRSLPLGAHNAMETT